MGNADIHNHRRIFVCSYMAALDDKGNRKCWGSFEGKGYTNHILKISTEKGLGEGGREREREEVFCGFGGNCFEGLEAKHV